MDYTVISSKDFKEKVLGWINRRDYISKDNLLQLFKGKTVEVSVYDGLEALAKTDNLQVLKAKIETYRLAGEFEGMLIGIMAHNIPPELKEKLQSKLTELQTKYKSNG